MPMPAVEAESGEIDVSKTRRFVEVKKGYTPFQKNDVLFAKITPCMENGKMAVVPDLQNNLSFGSTEFHVLRPCNGIEPKFVYFFVSSQAFRNDAEHNMSGAVGQRRVPTSYLEQSLLPLPPLNEQKRILAKIEELFSELDNGIKCLKTAREQLKVFRHAILKHAFEGKLTSAWRDKNKDKLETAYQLLEHIKMERHAKWEADLRAKGKDPAKVKYVELTKSDIESLPVLPEGWYWAKIEELFDVSYGLSESLSKTEADNEFDVPVIRMPNITEFGSLDLSALKYFPLSTDKKRSLLLQTGDVLFNWRNSPKWIGKSAVFDKDGEFVNASFLLKLRPYVAGYSSFVSAYLNYLRISGYFLTRVTNAVNQANFNASMTKEIVIPLPPLTEQHRISEEVERCLSIADEFETYIISNLKRAERLHQSILQDAFAGRLVSQDPNDEPASVLLERIRSEKTISQANNKNNHYHKVKPVSGYAQSFLIPETAV